MNDPKFQSPDYCILYHIACISIRIQYHFYCWQDFTLTDSDEQIVNLIYQLQLFTWNNLHLSLQLYLDIIDEIHFHQKYM